MIVVRSSWWQRRQWRKEAAVIGSLVQGDHYVNQIWSRIGGSSGSIYLALSSLEQKGFVRSDWIDVGDRAPRRRRYMLTENAFRKAPW